MSYSRVSDIVFNCQICRKNLSFNIDNSSSYVSVSGEEKIAGITIKTYEVSHSLGGVDHVNLVIVDTKGNLRGFSDSYINGHVVKPTLIEYKSRFNREEALRNSQTFVFFMIINLSENWVIDIVSPKDILPTKIAGSLVQNIKLSEDKLIEEGILSKLAVEIGKKIFQANILGDLVAVYILKNNNKKVIVEEIISNILPSDFIKNIQQYDFRSLKLLIRIIDEFPSDNLKVPYLIKVLEEGQIENPININDVSMVPAMVKSIFNQKLYPDELLIAIISILTGQKTVIELIETGYLLDFQEILEIIDFIKHRFE